MIEFWHWGIVGLVLLILEMLVSGFFLIWLGVAALAVALLMLVVPALFWHAQLTIWAVLFLASFLGWRMWRKKNPQKTDEAALNRRGEQYIGRHFTLAEPVVNGHGKIKVDDSIWKIAAAEDYPAGTRVTVTAVEGVLLRVSGVSAGPEDQADKDKAQP
ncbi:MAG: NfeD family protein [Alphaproteobacteria bacterium]|nr:NfeD family protein [Alphaproteobacteria bacterium]